VSANDALAAGIRIIKRLGDIRNYVSIEWRSGTATASSAESIDQYGAQAQIISTTLHNQPTQHLRPIFILEFEPFHKTNSIRSPFSLGNSEIDDSDRDALLNVLWAYLSTSLTYQPT
jgi:hypothetical protein